MVVVVTLVVRVSSASVAWVVWRRNDESGSGITFRGRREAEKRRCPVNDAECCVSVSFVRDSTKITQMRFALYPEASSGKILGAGPSPPLLYLPSSQPIPLVKVRAGAG